MYMYMHMYVYICIYNDNNDNRRVSRSAGCFHPEQNKKIRNDTMKTLNIIT